MQANIPHMDPMGFDNIFFEGQLCYETGTRFFSNRTFAGRIEYFTSRIDMKILCSTGTPQKEKWVDIKEQGWVNIKGKGSA